MMSAIVAPPALAQSGSALPFGGAETLVFQPPAGWVEVFRDGGAALRVAHLMPEGQDPERWRDMITVQVLKTPQPPTLADLNARAVAVYDAECEDRLGGSMQTGETDGYETGFWTLGCSRNSDSGLGETAFFKAMVGLEGVYIVQRAWQVDPFEPSAGPGIPDEEQRAAIALLQGVTLCLPDSQDHPCP
jgi:hypothetical protein